MKTLPLVLSVKSKNWRMYDDESDASDSEFQHVRKKALDRDNRTCRFCGFRNLSWQEVHHLNDDHSDNRLENLITACMWCHMCQHIGLAGHNEEAVLAWIPEISQADLHHLVRCVLVAQREEEVLKADPTAKRDAVERAREVAAAATSLFGLLKSRQAQASNLIGTSSPLQLGNVMLNMPDDIYENRAEFLRGMRLLPLGVRVAGGDNVMPKIIDSWRANGGPFANLRPQAWAGLLRAHLR